uniref:Reverse transcriptase domain-containing protein n=1 Tax=Anopheles christyi TaxID=43041 RepID=A0A182KEU8_9DIPT
MVNYLEDIPVFRNTKEEHDQNLSEALSRLQQHNFMLNPAKHASFFPTMAGESTKIKGKLLRGFANQ